MVKFPQIFSHGETGLAYQYFPAIDREMGCLIIQNFWCDESFAWRARGGSRKIDSISEVLSVVSYKDYFLIKTATKLLIYNESSLRLTINYTGNFDIGAFAAESVNPSDTASTEVDRFTIGLYVASNLSGGNFVDVSGRLQIAGSANWFTINKDNCLININNNTFTNVTTPAGLLKKQFISNILHLNQRIYLTLEKDGVQTIQFFGGTTDSIFSYKLASASQYKKLIKYSNGFILVGTRSSEVFTTSENSSFSIFTPSNIFGYEMCVGNIEYIACDENLVVYSFVDYRDVYIQLISSGYSSTYKRVHNEISRIKGIQTISGRPQKFMILYEDGIIDVIYGVNNGEKSFKFINSRLKFYGPVEELINGYAGKLFFRIGNVFQLLDFDSERYLDNWVDYLSPSGLLEPSKIFIPSKVPLEQNSSSQDYGLNYKYVLQPEANEYVRIILQQKFNLSGRFGLDNPFSKCIFNIDTKNISLDFSKFLYIDLNFNLVVSSFSIGLYFIIQFDGVEISKLIYTNMSFTENKEYILNIRYSYYNGEINIISNGKNTRSALDFVLGRFKNTHELVVGVEDEYYDSKDVYFGELIEYIFVTNDINNHGHQMYSYPKMNPRFLINTVNIKSIKPVSTVNVQNYVYGMIEYSDNMFKPDLISYEKNHIRTTSWYNWNSITPAFKGSTDIAFCGLGSVEPFDVFLMWLDVLNVNSRGMGS